VPVFFGKAGRIIREVQQFANEVERTVVAFNNATLSRLEQELLQYGVGEIGRQHIHLVRKHFPSGEPPRLLMALVTRHVNRWTQKMRSAFAVARESVPEFENPVRARDITGRPRTIGARLDAEPGATDTGGRVLYGVLTATPRRKKFRRIIRRRLVPHLKLLVQVTPRNLQRDFIMLLSKIRDPRPIRRQGASLIHVSAHVGPTTCKTCLALQNRVLTRAAHRFAVTRLRPQLYHPRCRHHPQLKGLTGVSLANYDPRVHGEVITKERLLQMARSGTVDLQSERPAFVTT